MNKEKRIKLWASLMRMGDKIGCHQIEERSFHIKGWQFPICSRCTGVLAGQIICVIIYLLSVRIPIYISLVFLLIMFLDWFIQYKGVKESNNIRRFITGTLAGIGQISITIELIIMIIKWIM